MPVRAVARTARALGLPGRGVLVAASGGLDSTALVHLLHGLREELGLKLSIGHVNHGLRGAESEADEAFLRELAAGLGLPVHVARVEPAALRRGGPSRTRPTLQEAARRQRYAALAELAGRAAADRVATAHTADDQAETVLLRLLRGSGPDGLAGIPERSADGRIVRPLLRVERAQLRAWADARSLRWREDASNADTRYARSRLRHDWLPGLARAFNPRALRAIADLAEAQRRDGEWIAQQVDREAALRFTFEPGGLRIERKDWDGLHEALARRLARRALEVSGAGRDVSRVHLERVLAFLRGARPGARLELPGGLELRSAREAFHLVHRVPPGVAC